MRTKIRRKAVTVATVAGLGVLPAGLGLALPEARAAGGTGTFGAPFREDGYTVYDKETGCKPGTTTPLLDCLPAGASMVMLPNGKILYWNALEGTENVPMNAVLEGQHYTVNDQTRVLGLNLANPAASTFVKPSPVDGGANPGGNISPYAPADPENNDGDLFCSDQVILADGRVLAVGGTDYYGEIAPPAAGLPGLGGIPGTNYSVIELEGLKNARIFDPATNAWTQSGSMKFGRWYPSLVTLPDGNVFVASGVTKLVKPIYPDRPLDSGTNVKQTETYDLKAGTWSLNKAGSEKSLPLFPRLHLLPDGHVYYDANGQAFNPFGQSIDEVLWNMASSYDPATQTWNDLGIPGTGSLFPGFRGSTFSSMLPLTAPYDKASFLTAGGVIGTTPGSYVPVADSRVTTVSLAGGKESLTTRSTGALNRARWYGTGVALPTGQVMVFSGATLDEVDAPGTGTPIRNAEIFTPDGSGGGTWSDAGLANRGRTYHNNAILLPDGSVLVGGHAPIPFNYTAIKFQPQGLGLSNQYHDASFEVYRPPYLDPSRGPRPTISGAPKTVHPGTSFRIKTPDAADVESVVLVRNTAQTHLIDGDQRTVVLPISKRGAGGLTVDLTENGNVVPPGPYMLFLNKKGAGGTVPSVSAPVTVTSLALPELTAALSASDADVLDPPSSDIDPASSGSLDGVRSVGSAGGSRSARSETTDPASASGSPRAQGAAAGRNLASSAISDRRNGDTPTWPFTLAGAGLIGMVGDQWRRTRRRIRG